MQHASLIYFISLAKQTIMNQTDYENYDVNKSDLFNQLELDDFRSSSHVLLTVTGIPLNSIIVIVILSNQRLKKKPRNILLLGMSLASIFTFLTILIEFLSHHYQSQFLCKMFCLSTGIAYTYLLYNLLLSLLDRYFAIVKPLRHRKRVTIKSVLIAQGTGATFIILLIKWPFIFGVLSVQCGIVPLQSKIIAISNVILLILCVIFNVLVYTKTKRYVRPNRAVSVSYVNNHQAQSILHQPVPLMAGAADDVAENLSGEQQVAIQFADDLNQEMNEPSLVRPSRTAAVNQQLTPLRVHGGTREMEVIYNDILQHMLFHNSNRFFFFSILKIEATFTLVAGVLSLLIFTLPTLIIGFIQWGCRVIMLIIARNDVPPSLH